MTISFPRRAMHAAGLVGLLLLPLPAAAQTFGKPTGPTLPRVQTPNLPEPDPFNNRYDSTRQQRLKNERLVLPPGCVGDLTATERARCRAKARTRTQQ